MRSLFFMLLLMSLIGCASIKDTYVFNGETSETIQADITHVLKQLPRRDKSQFIMALLAIQFSDVNGVSDLIGDPAMDGMNYDILSKKLDGLTYVQVIALASKSKTKVEMVKN
ncbi:DUF6694 family lipoprotein [Shewanella sp. A14]